MVEREGECRKAVQRFAKSRISHKGENDKMMWVSWDILWLYFVMKQLYNKQWKKGDEKIAL